MKKHRLYLGGEEIDENELAPKDFADFIVAFLNDIRGKK
jgi:hypothetical protein